MAIINLSCTGAGVMQDYPSANFYNPAAVDFSSSSYNALALKFQALPSQYLYRKQLGIYLNIYGTLVVNTSYTSYTTWTLRVHKCEDFNPQSLSYNIWRNLIMGVGYSTDPKEPNSWTNFSIGPYLKLETGPTCLSVQPSTPGRSNYVWTRIQGPGSSSAPYLRVELSDEDVKTRVEGLSPTSGWVDRRQQIQFKWELKPEAWTPGTFTQKSAVLRWRRAGTSAWTFYNIGADSSYTLPANTLPGNSNIQWYVSATNNLGYSSSSPIYTISTIDAQTRATPTYPISGASVDETQTITFRWTTSNEHNTPQTRADLQWSTDGQNWNALATISGDTKHYSAPPNTFPGAVITWRVRAYNLDNVAGPWATATFSTVDSAAVAKPIAPVSTVEAGDAPITFRWNTSNDSGSAPTRADLRWSADNSTWNALATITGTGTTYTAAAYKFPVGVVYWQVRAYNRNGTAGPWASASFVAIAAPPRPSVTVDPVPFATISWQSSGQQAYRLTVDGTVYGPYFGTEKVFRVPDYLSDGEHTATVSVQGDFGLWSEKGSVSFTIQNIPGGLIELTGGFDVDAALSWTDSMQGSDYYIYRDDVQIGRTGGMRFTDRFVLGEHSYRVISRLPDGNYSPSGEVAGVMRSCVTRIAPFAGGDWTVLKLSENSDSEQRFSWSKTVSLRHVAGARFPVLEESAFEDGSASYDVAFPDASSAQAFEALKGQIVIIKSRGGRVVVGALTQLDNRMTDFYLSYNFTVQRIHWEDFIDDKND